MSRAAARTTCLGGIGLMLEVAHVCPRCGMRLQDTPSAAASHRLERRCLPTVFAALPEPELREEDGEVSPSSAARQIYDFEMPAGLPAHAGLFGDVPVATGSPGAYRSLSAPWLRPPDLGEVL